MDHSWSNDAHFVHQLPSNKSFILWLILCQENRLRNNRVSWQTTLLRTHAHIIDINLSWHLAVVVAQRIWHKRLMENVKRGQMKNVRESAGWSSVAPEFIGSDWLFISPANNRTGQKLMNCLFNMPYPTCLLKCRLVQFVSITTDGQSWSWFCWRPRKHHRNMRSLEIELMINWNIISISTFQAIWVI